MEDERKQDLLSLGTWLGRKQTFAVVAGRCTAASAECLRNVRDKKLYRGCGVTWTDFCRRYLGMSRSLADQLIRQLEEFGPGYFRLAEVARITPESFRLIAPSVTEEGVNCGGELIPFTPENAGKIAAAVEQLRAQAKVQQTPPAPDDPARSLRRVKKSFVAALAELERIGALTSDVMEKQPYYALIDETIWRLTQLNTVVPRD